MKHFKKTLAAVAVGSALLGGAGATMALWQDAETVKYHAPTPSWSGTFSVGDQSWKFHDQNGNDEQIGEIYKDSDFRSVDLLTQESLNKLAQDKQIAIPITLSYETFGNIGLAGPHEPLLLSEGQHGVNVYQLMSGVSPGDYEAHGFSGPLLGQVSDMYTSRVSDPSQCSVDSTPTHEPFEAGDRGYINLTTSSSEDFKDLGRDSSYYYNPWLGADDQRSVTICVVLDLPKDDGVSGGHTNTVTATGVAPVTGATAQDEDSFTAQVQPREFDYTQAALDQADAGVPQIALSPGWNKIIPGDFDYRDYINTTSEDTP